MESTPLKVALIGSGRYAPVFVGILQKLDPPVAIKYIWSRTGDSAKLLQLQNEYTAETQVATGAEGYAEILRDPEVAAVILVLPPHVGPQLALQAVEAGKAALSEKPVAATVAAARDLVGRYHAMSAPPPWLVGENFRFQSVLAAAAAVVSEKLGTVYKMEHVCDVPFPKKTSYLSCAWRRDDEALPGGYMADLGVHEVAALRVVAEAAGAGAPVSACAHASHDPSRGLTAPDTLVGFVEWESGLRTSISIGLAAAFPRMSLSLSAANGTLEISRSMWNGKGRSAQHELTYRTEDPDELESAMHDIDGMEREVAAFVAAAAAWRAGTVVDAAAAADVAKGAPEEALMDLAIVEALLASARAGGAPTRVEGNHLRPSAPDAM